MPPSVVAAAQLAEIAAGDALYFLEPVLAARERVIGDHFKLSPFSGRTVLPGAREQALPRTLRSLP